MLFRHAFALLSLALFGGCARVDDSDVVADTGVSNVNDADALETGGDAAEVSGCPKGLTTKLPGIAGATESAVVKDGKLQVLLDRPSGEGSCGDGPCDGVEVFRDGVSGDFSSRWMSST